MTFLLDADFKDKTRIIESTNWEIKPIVLEGSSEVMGYDLLINGESTYSITPESYKRILNAFMDTTPIKRIFLCRKTVATIDRGL